MSSASARIILPRLIRMRDAPAYLGIDKNRFNAEVRPHLIEIPLGEHGIAFDRLDLDAWVDEYIARNGRKRETTVGGETWQNAQPVSRRGAKPGTSTKGSADTADFAKALAQVRSRKRSDTT